MTNESYSQLPILAFVIPFALFFNVNGQPAISPEAVFYPSNIVFREAVTGLVQPIFIANAGDGSNRLFYPPPTCNLFSL